MATYGGLRPYNTGATGGEAITQAFKIVSGVSGDMFQGDTIKQLNTGGVSAGNADGDVNILGVLAGVNYTNSEGERVYTNKYTDTIEATDSVAFVYVNPFQLYICKVGNGSGADDVILGSDVGMSIDFDVTNAGNGTTGQSGVLLEDGTEAVTARARIVAVSNNDGTDPLTEAVASEYTHAIVQLDPATLQLLNAGI
jgi:hypothetical protein